MSANSIGSFDFLRMDNPPAIPAEQKIVQARSGIDLVSVYHTGRRSPVSETRTVTFASDLDWAYEAYRQYLALVDSGAAVSVQWAGITMPYKVQALACEKAPGMPKPHIKGVGPGFTSRARLVCLWRLQVVEEII